jgi:predicted transcriptional regulator
MIKTVPPIVMNYRLWMRYGRVSKKEGFTRQLEGVTVKGFETVLDSFQNLKQYDTELKTLLTDRFETLPV